MAYEIFQLRLDLQSDKATVALQDKPNDTMVHVTLKVQTPGDQTESALKQAVQEAAKQALLDAADAI